MRIPLPTSQTIAPWALVLAAFFWGSSFVALKHATSVFHPSLVVLGRMVVAALCFMALQAWWRNQHYVRGDWKYFLLMALAEPCLYSTLETYAVQYTSASSAGVINALLPPMVALASWLVLGERMGLYGLLGLLISIGGAIMLSLCTPSSSAAPQPLLGNALELGAMAASCVYVITLKKVSARYSALFLTAIQAFIGTIFFTPWAIYQPMPTHWSLSGMLAIVYLGVFVSLGGYFLFHWGIMHMRASQASVYVNLVPVFAIVTSMLVLGEQLSAAQLGAAAVVVVGVLISQRQGPK